MHNKEPVPEWHPQDFPAEFVPQTFESQMVSRSACFRVCALSITLSSSRVAIAKQQLMS